jgi:hypothetical protein
MTVLKFPAEFAEGAITAGEIEEFRQLDATPPFDEQGAVGWTFEGEPQTAQEKRWLVLYNKMQRARLIS